MAQENAPEHPYLRYLIHHHLHHHHLHQNHHLHNEHDDLLFNFTNFQNDEFTATPTTTTTNESSLSGGEGDAHLLLLLPPLDSVLLRALLGQLVLGVTANGLLLASVIASMRDAQKSHAHRRSVYSSVSSTSYSSRLGHAHRQTPVVDQIVALLAGIALLRLLTRAGVQVLCYYVSKHNFIFVIFFLFKFSF